MYLRRPEALWARGLPLGMGKGWAWGGAGPDQLFGRFGATVAIGLTIFVLSVVTIIICFTCSCCCLYKMCRRPRRKHCPHLMTPLACSCRSLGGQEELTRPLLGYARGTEGGPASRPGKLVHLDWDSFCSHRDHHHSHHRGARPLPSASKCTP